MQDGNTPPPAPSRPWEIVAQELNRETNLKRLLELSEELNRALKAALGALPKGK